MSQAAIDRWNAIPLVRQKRSRTPSDKDDDTDDDVSLVSRTPSPEPTVENLNEYDKHHRGYEREVITVETKLKETNIGHKMLQKMGWKEGEGLGISGQGRPDPVPFKLKSDLTGLGKTTQDVRMITLTVAQRRDLDSERQSRETEAQKKAREDKVAKKEAIKSEITTSLRAFYCELCDKQYQNVTQYNEHIRSYAHTHKQRFKEMEAAQRPKDNSKAREKERKREEKELKRLAAASGVKLATTAAAASVANPAAVPTTSVVAPTGGSKGGGWGNAFKAAHSNPGGFKKSGWAAVASSAPILTNDSPPNPGGSGTPDRALAAPSTSNIGFKKSGWTSISASAAPADSPAPPRSPPPPPPSDIETRALPDEPPLGGKPPAFTRGRFTNLDTTSEPLAVPGQPPTSDTSSLNENGVPRVQLKTSITPMTIMSDTAIAPSPPKEPAAPPPPAPPNTIPPPPPPPDYDPPSPPRDRPTAYDNRIRDVNSGRRFDGPENGYNRRPRDPYNSDGHTEPWAMDVDDRDDRQRHFRGGGWQRHDRDASRPGYGYGSGGRDRGNQNLRGHGYGGGRSYYAGDGRR